ncbi:MAG: universal stress protein, partial [Planctomycetales bacterium]|nr:universal stress protein [Planctomycetales bacterium]
MQILADLGVAAGARVRHGLVVHEILAEIGEEVYDLVVVGAHGEEG